MAYRSGNGVGESLSFLSPVFFDYDVAFDSGLCCIIIPMVRIGLVVCFIAEISSSCSAWPPRLKLGKQEWSKRLALLLVQQLLDPLPNGQTARQARTLNPEQIHPPFVPFLFANDKIVKPFALVHDGASRGQLGPDAGVVGRQGTHVDAGQVALDLLGGGGHAVPVDGEVVGPVDPLDVGAKLDLAGHVEGEVGAQPAVAGLRGGVDERRDLWLGRGVGKVVALGVVRLLLGLVVGHDEVVHVGGAQPGRVDEHVGRDGAVAARGAVAHADLPPVLALLVGTSPEGRDAHDGRTRRERPARLLDVAQQRDHERVRVDDARRGALEAARLGAHRRLPTAQLLPADPPHGDAPP